MEGKGRERKGREGKGREEKRRKDKWEIYRKNNLEEIIRRNFVSINTDRQRCCPLTELLVNMHCSLTSAVR